MPDDTVLIVNLLETVLIRLNHLDRKVSSLMFDKEAKAEKEELALLKGIDAKCDRILAALGSGGGAPTPTPTPVPVPLPPTVIQVAWINQSQGDLSDVDAAKIVEALNLQVVDLDAAWPHISTDNVHHVLVPTIDMVSVDAWPMVWLPNPDVAGALGWHDVSPTGQPYGRVFTRYNGTPWPALQPGPDGITISNISSHEACEIAVDPTCAATATAPDGKIWALEDCDPVEASQYSVTVADGTSVSLSDYVTAAFFGMGTGPVDHTAAATTAFTLAPGGYALINGVQVFADKPSVRYLSQQGSPAGRTYRRLQQ